MPVDRLFHPRARNSKKVTSLTDFEFRVWWTYEMAADDYGVMRASPVVLQAANARLAQSPAGRVTAALKRLIDVALLVEFQHQDVAYVCQLDWQDFQKVRYPRETHEPIPPPEILQRCSASTRELFQKRFGNSSAIDQQVPRAYTRETQTANGSRQTAEGDSPAERVQAAYRASWQRAYGVPCSLLLKPLEFSDLLRQIEVLGEPAILRALEGYFATDDAFVRRNKHPFGVFLREPMKFVAGDAVTRPTRPRGCRHEPPCADDAAHTKRYLQEQRAS